MQRALLDPRIHPAAIVLAGVALSFLSALSPTEAHAVRLEPLQAVAGLIPYALYGLIAALQPSDVVNRVALVALALHLFAALAVRGLGEAAGLGLYLVPLVAAGVLLVLLPQAVKASAISAGRPAALPEKNG